MIYTGPEFAKLRKDDPTGWKVMCGMVRKFVFAHNISDLKKDFGLNGKNRKEVLDSVMKMICMGSMAIYASDDGKKFNVMTIKAAKARHVSEAKLQK